MKKLFTLAVALLATLCVNAEDLYVIGTINSWTLADEAYKMTAVSETEWTFDFGTTELVGQNFKINNGTWDEGATNLGSSEKLNVGTINLTQGGDNIQMADGFSSITNVKITLKKDAEGNYTLTAEGTFTEGQAAVPDLYLRGDVNSWGTDNKFDVVTEGTEWTLTMDVDPTTFGSFKIADKDWGSYNIGGDGTNGVTVGEEYSLVKGSNPGNLWFVEGTEAGSYAFDLYHDTDDSWTLTVTKGASAVNTVNATAAGKVVLKKTLKGIVNGNKMYNFAGAQMK